ncbi:VOC family protein, partial [Nitriliruptor sp.]|uniref:VOC family protein n=1 Tax=Nitriliruptor sp. TaxID=2448056 RepID=UPI0034A07A34
MHRGRPPVRPLVIGAPVPPELGHVVLHVRDLERAQRFYTDLLGWRVRGPVG